MKQDLQKKMADIISKPSYVVLAFLFGSQAKGVARESSDFDIGIMLSKNLTASQRVSLKTKLSDRLSKLLKNDVDIVIINTAGTLLKYQIAKDGKLLFERKANLAKKFRLLAIKEYFDYLPTFNFHYNRLKRSAKS